MSQDRALVPATFLIDVLGQFHLHSAPQFSLLTKKLKHPEMNKVNRALASEPTTYTG